MFKKLIDNFWILIVLAGIYYVLKTFIFQNYPILIFNIILGIGTIIYGLLLRHIVKLSKRKLPKIDIIGAKPEDLAQARTSGAMSTDGFTQTKSENLAPATPVYVKTWDEALAELKQAEAENKTSADSAQTGATDGAQAASLQTDPEQLDATDPETVISASQAELSSILANSFWRAFTAWASMLLLHATLISFFFNYPLTPLLILVFSLQAAVYFSRTGGFVDARLNKKDFWIKVAGAISGIAASVLMFILFAYAAFDIYNLAKVFFVPPAIGAILLIVNRVLRA